MWRVNVRPATTADPAAVDPWLGEALCAVAGSASPAGEVSLDGLQEALAGGHELRLIALDSGVPVGLIISSRVDSRRRAIDMLAIAAGVRNLGYGAEAIYRLEAEEPATALLAGVPVENGLAIYFWLRLGYAPMFPRPAEAALASDRIWMARGGENGRR